MSELPLLLLALAAIFASNGWQGLRQGGGNGQMEGGQTFAKTQENTTDRNALIN